MPSFGSFSEIEAARDELSGHLAVAKQRMDGATAEFGRIVDLLAQVEIDYGPIIQATADLLAADPTNQALITLNAQIALHLADFNTVNAQAAAKRTAVEAA